MYENQQFGVSEFYKTPLGRSFAKLILADVDGLLGGVANQKILLLGHKIHGFKDYENLAANIQYRSIKGVQVLPFSDESFDKVIVLHSIEFSDHLAGCLREVWRLTKSSGKAIFMVPNRRGFLVRSDKTPFGFGQPFSKSQFKKILLESNFSNLSFQEALCMPVWALTKGDGVIELSDKIGRLLWPQFCGVYFVSCHKQIKGFVLDDGGKKPNLAITPSSV